MTTMTRGFFGLRQAVLAITTRADVMYPSITDRVGADGRPATLVGHDERIALRRDYAFVEAAANAALRGARV